MSHLESNSLISQEQHGFLPGKSCCTNLQEFMEKVTSAVDEGVPYDVIFLDFVEAFDKVPREIVGKAESTRYTRQNLAECCGSETGFPARHRESS
jgi:hypothetical protein